MTGPLSKVLAVRHMGWCWLSEALGRLSVPLFGICGTVRRVVGVRRNIF
ncbi:hypothetical protein [uncultured Bilophila sp.]|nr:hypothetical protein [uncultured Bilophila sp.]